MSTTEKNPTEQSRRPARFYTRARKFPRMVGRLPEGTRIWGGPYTFTQIVSGVLVAIVALFMRPLWGTGSILVDLGILIGVLWGSAYLTGKIPLTNLNPAVLVANALHGFSTPRQGTFKGAPIKVTAAHRSTTRCLIDPGPQPSEPPRAPVTAVPVNPDQTPAAAVVEPPVVVEEEAPVVVREVVSASVAPSGRSKTGLERLLEQTSTTRK